jgi:hypothetical protein
MSPLRSVLGPKACKEAGRQDGWIDHRQTQSTQSDLLTRVKRPFSRTSKDRSRIHRRRAFLNRHGNAEIVPATRRVVPRPTLFKAAGRYCVEFNGWVLSRHRTLALALPVREKIGFPRRWKQFRVGFRTPSLRPQILTVSSTSAVPCAVQPRRR